jgi:SAM-dependent methyltransferase
MAIPLPVKRYVGRILGISALQAGLRHHEERLTQLENLSRQPNPVAEQKALTGHDPQQVRKLVAQNYLSGQGIEIGAFASPLPVPASVRVQYLEKFTSDEIKRQFSFAGLNLADFGFDETTLIAPDILDDGESLAKIGDNSQDFIIANHVLEHMENPVKAFKNMLRVTKHHGFIYIALPDMRLCFDRNRQPTPIEHIFRDYQEGPEWSLDMAYQEFAEIFLAEGMDKGLIERKYGEHRKQHLQQVKEALKTARYDIHFHAWTLDQMLEMFGKIKQRINLFFEFKLVLQNHDEVIFVFQKTVPHIEIRNDLPVQNAPATI